MQDSGNATKEAPLRGASAMRSQAFSAVCGASRKIDAVWHAAALKRGKFEDISDVLHFYDSGYGPRGM
jgi:hypothetical protein